MFERVILKLLVTCKILNTLDIDGVELNFSCPNVTNIAEIAKAVEDVGSGNFINPTMSIETIAGIENYMKKYNIKDINEIEGKNERENVRTFSLSYMRLTCVLPDYYCVRILHGRNCFDEI